MRCKECGAVLLDTDTFCGKCGAKVKLNICPNCGETLRPGMRFCASCGYKVVEDEKSEPAEETDDDIPVTGGLKTTEIPFDLIEQSIIRDVERQLDVPAGEKDARILSNQSQAEPDEEDAYSEDNFDSYEDGYAEEDYPDDYDDADDDEYYEDDESEEMYPDEEDDFSKEEAPSLGSRLLTAGMIVIGLIILIIIASVFFNSRNKQSDDGGTETEETTEDESTDEDEETSENGEAVIGTIEVIENVNIRDYPDKDNSNILGVAKAGETYEYYGYAENNNGWIHIKVDDDTDGYVYKDYVQIKE